MRLLKTCFILCLNPLLVFAKTEKLAPPPILANQVLNDHLSSIDERLAHGEIVAAIQESLNSFGLNASNCREIKTVPIAVKDLQGNDTVAQTRLDQTIILDPGQMALKSARYLVSILAHEITHCDQNQKMYSMALAADSELAPLREKIHSLRKLAELDDLADVALKESPVKIQAMKKFKETTGKIGLEITPSQLTALTKRVLEDVQVYQKNLGELHEMEAALRAFEIPGVLTPPKASEKALPEFDFQYRFLMLSTNRFLQTRSLYGMKGEAACRMSNLVPLETTMQHERNCIESINLLKAYLGKMQG